jgi:hypothetical protein
MSDNDVTKNVYTIGDVLFAMGFFALFMFLAFMLGYGMGMSCGHDAGMYDAVKKDGKP